MATLKEQAFASTLSRNTYSASQLVLCALLAGTTPILLRVEESHDRGSSIALTDAATAPTASSLHVTVDDVDAQLASEMQRVMVGIASRQVELDRVAKQVLYGRMKGFYRR